MHLRVPKKLIVFALALLAFSGCDPVSSMEATIGNLTAENLRMEFIPSDENLPKTLQLTPNGRVLFQEGFDVGNSFLAPSLVEYDSVIVKNQAGAILRVYRESDRGKNIYRIEEYWKASEPSKRFFKYDYEITPEDFE